MKYTHCVLTGSEKVCADQVTLVEIKVVQALVNAGGGGKALARHVSGAKMLPRDWVERLFDAG